VGRLECRAAEPSTSRCRVHFGGIAMPMVIADGARGCRTLEPEPALLIGCQRRTSRGGRGLPKLRANRS